MLTDEISRLQAATCRRGLLTQACTCMYTPTQSSSKRKKEQERSAVLVERLQEERQRQEDNHRLVMARLKQEKDSWFSASESVCCDEVVLIVLER